MKPEFVYRILAAAFLTLYSSTWAAFAQPAGPGPFASACNSALNDIQDDRRVCVVGIVQDDTKVRVLFSNKSALIFKVAEVFQSPPQQGQKVPLDGLGKLKGQTVAVGGFENGTTIFSAKLLVP
jgi:hypothetical protein